MLYWSVCSTASSKSSISYRGPTLWNKILKHGINPETSEAIFNKFCKKLVKNDIIWIWYIRRYYFDNNWYTYTVLLCIILGFWLLWAHFFFCTSCTLHPVILHITYLYPCSTKLKAGYTGIRLSICLYGRPLTQPRSPGCNSSTIMLKLDRDVPWVKISAEFVHGRRSMFKWGLNDLINYFDLISLLPLFRVQFFYDRG